MSHIYTTPLFLCLNIHILELPFHSPPQEIYRFQCSYIMLRVYLCYCSMLAQLSGWGPLSTRMNKYFTLCQCVVSNDTCTQVECENEAAESLPCMCKVKAQLW